MKICLAQTKPVKGDVKANISHHVQLIRLALQQGADTIIFPELSITGYEPTLAKALATTPGDSRFSVFQNISDTNNLTIIIGVPLQTTEGITISLLLFQPHQQRERYAKQFLHPDEEPFFVSGQLKSYLHGDTALAICYELSVPEHAEKARESGAKLYLASVAKTAEGVNKATGRLAAIAKQYSMTALMVNCIGPCDGVICGGRSAAWDNKGNLLGQLPADKEGLLVLDTDTRDVLIKIS